MWTNNTAANKCEHSQLSLYPTHPGYVPLSEEGEGLGDLQLTGQLRVRGLLHSLYAPVKPHRKRAFNDRGNELGRREDGSLRSRFLLLLNSP